MEREFPKGKYFSAAAQYIDDVISAHLKDEAARKQREEERRRAEADERAEEQAKAARADRDERLKACFDVLDPRTQNDLWNQAMNAAPSNFDREQIKKARADGRMHFVLLDVLEAQEARSKTMAA